MSDNWVVQALQSAFEIWNDKLTEIWSLITTTPQEFRGGDIWNAIVGINEGLKAVGYGLLVLFFAMGIFQSAASFRDLQRPEYALRHFIRFIAAKVAVSSAMEIMTVVFSICGGIVQSVMSGMGGMVAKLPDEFHSAPDILTNDVLKVLAVHQRNEPVVVGQTQRIVNRVHPLDRKLHRPPAVQHAGRRVNM